MTSGLRFLVAVVILLSGLASAAHAGGEYHHTDRNFYAQSDSRPFSTYIRGIGTFSGIRAYKFRDHGIYYSRAGNRTVRSWRHEELRPLGHPLIITVNPKTTRQACVWESGVCVIRN